jgi:hypothetical protein
MAAGEIRAGEAFVEIATKNNLSKELDKISAKLKAFGTAFQEIGKKVMGAGALIVAPLALASVAFAKMGKDMENASERTGVAVESLSALSYAAEQSGASMEDLEKALGKMEKTIFQAAGGSAELQDALRSVGTSVEELKGMSPENRFLKIADAIGSVSEQSAKTGLAMEIFGKGAASLLPLFNGGAEGARKMVERARELGIVMSGPDAQAAKAWSNSLDDLVQQFKVITFQVGAAVSSVLRPFATSATKIMRSVIDWTKANKPLVAQLLTFGAALVAGGALVVALGTAFVAAGSVIGGVTTVMSTVGSAIALLMNPIVLVIGGLGALAAYFAYSSGAGGEALAYLGAKFDELRGIADESFGGIADALAAGDIALAAQMLWTELKLAWNTGTQTLKSYWYLLRYSIIEGAAEMFFGAAEIWEDAKELIKTSWENTTSFLRDLWGGFVGYFSAVWDNAANLVMKGLNIIHGLWDKTFDSKAANAAADAMLAANEAARRKGEMADHAGNEASRKKTTDQYKAAHDAAIDRYARRHSDIDTGAYSNMESDTKADADAIPKLHKELRGLRAQAKRERGASLQLPDKPSLADYDPAGGSTKSPGGIFNIAALASLRTSSPLNDIRKFTKQTADNTKKGLVFG